MIFEFSLAFEVEAWQVRICSFAPSRHFCAMPWVRSTAIRLAIALDAVGSPELRPSLSKSAAGGVLRESLDGVRWKSGGSLQEGGAGRYNNDSICEPKIQNHKILLYQFHRPYFLLIQDEGRSTIWKKKSTKSKKFQKTFRS